ncbi:heparan-alpha-glucosaminide N-acetyltransferase domain-containing protein [Olleya sp. YS]|uniref:heparan-alpha-glucosaminide N-acetyltransferase domain-containing protein n=1 Tax=Olleya sp. YS TaxID=3028318 RepID=UPI00243465F7|nr:heparan-alpha-glucosaminide N-acetyltransferase domain-containing protein [Olleya sp. YS]WGD34292.1 heparan-alpha-glucosaminide N-acetyltransferase domain-containing protein [Olleya sp. YS]
MKPTRLYFLDAVRAFAILMMLQGHFIDTLLHPMFRDKSNTAYMVWSYMRGITAPVFFTITGLVFMYLLLKAKEKGTDSTRIKKGVERGLSLILIGYALRFSFISLMFGELNLYFLEVDVLQCIGLSLLLLITIYTISFKNEWLLALLFLVLGFTIFVSEPLYRDLKLEHTPILFANYLSKQNGSVFTIIPWFGYVCFGGFIAVLFSKFGMKNYYKRIKIIGFFVVGVIMLKFSSSILIRLDNWFDIPLFKDSAYYNYLFSRLGNVLIIFGLFYTFERYLKQAVITKIGQKTLSIYVIHFIIIYGSFTSIGLNRFFSKSLEPAQAIIGAIIFMVVVCLISFYYVKTNTFIYNKIRQLYERLRSNK